MIALARDLRAADAARAARPQPGGARAAAGAVVRLGLHHEDRHHGRVRHPADQGARAPLHPAPRPAPRRSRSTRAGWPTSSRRTTSSRRSTTGCTSRGRRPARRAAAAGRGRPGPAPAFRGSEAAAGAGRRRARSRVDGPGGARHSLASPFPRGNREMADQTPTEADDLGTTEREIIASRREEGRGAPRARREPLRQRPRRRPTWPPTSHARYGEAPAEEIAKDPGDLVGGRPRPGGPQLRQGRLPQGARPLRRAPGLGQEGPGRRRGLRDLQAPRRGRPGRGRRARPPAPRPASSPWRPPPSPSLTKAVRPAAGEVARPHRRGAALPAALRGPGGDARRPRDLP